MVLTRLITVLTRQLSSHCPATGQLGLFVSHGNERSTCSLGVSKAIKRSARVPLEASRGNCGAAWINTHLAPWPEQPFAGFKWNGIGVENGPWRRAEFSDFQVVHRPQAPDGLNLNAASLLS